MNRHIRATEKLTTGKSEFIWKTDEQNSFKILKLIVNASLLKYYDTPKPVTTIQSESSSYAFCFVLKQSSCS